MYKSSHDKVHLLEAHLEVQLPLSFAEIKLIALKILCVAAVLVEEENAMETM